jgi:hypothetical protein
MVSWLPGESPGRGWFASFVPCETTWLYCDKENRPRSRAHDTPAVRVCTKLRARVDRQGWTIKATNADPPPTDRSRETRARAELALVWLLYELRDDDVFLVVLGGLVPELLACDDDRIPEHLGTPTLTSCSSRTSRLTLTLAASSER